MKIDEFEPMQIATLLQQSESEALVTALNRNGWADYLWNTHDGTPEQVERKQYGEAAADPAKVEIQLNKELSNCPNTILLVEGIGEAIGPNEIQLYELAKNGRGFRTGRKLKSSYERFEGWLLSLERVGLLVVRTTSWVGTAKTLHLLAQSAMRSEHQALQKHLKIRAPFHENPHVKTLMQITKADIGPVTAENLIKVFGTAWDVMRQDPDIIAENVEGMGMASATKLLRAFGRNV